MTPSNRKHSLMITILLILTFFVFTVLFPSIEPVIGITFLLISFGIASFTIVNRNRKQHLQGQITRNVFLRNTSLDILGVLLAMVLAGFLGWYISRALLEKMSHYYARFIAGILLGILVGVFVGLFVKRIWGRLIKA